MTSGVELKLLDALCVHPLHSVAASLVSQHGKLSGKAVTPCHTHFDIRSLSRLYYYATAFAIVWVVLVVGLFFSSRRHRPHRVPRGMPSTTPAQASCPSGLGLTRLGPTRLDSIGRVLRWDPKAENQRRRNIVCFLSKYIKLVQNSAKPTILRDPIIRGYSQSHNSITNRVRDVWILHPSIMPRNVPLTTWPKVRAPHATSFTIPSPPTTVPGLSTSQQT